MKFNETFAQFAVSPNDKIRYITSASYPTHPEREQNKHARRHNTARSSIAYPGTLCSAYGQRRIDPKVLSRHVKRRCLLVLLVGGDVSLSVLISLYL